MDLTLDQLLKNAINLDIEDTVSKSFISVMARKGQSLQTDIPVAHEVFALLSHFKEAYPVIELQLDSTEAIRGLEHGIYHDPSSGRVLLLITVAPGDFAYVAHWVADCLPSEKVKNMPGTLGLFFSTEVHDETPYLIPEWFSAYFVGNELDGCIPILILKSVLRDERFSDWVMLALERMKLFNLHPNNAILRANHTQYSHTKATF